MTQPSQTTSARQWTAALPLTELPPGSRQVWKIDGRQLLLVHTAAGECFAIDNRCPHEGYPLQQGEVQDCRLTCTWHNWKFDLRDGRCLLGGEGVRSYPVRSHQGVWEVDLSDPDPEQAIPPLLKSLQEALFRHDVGRFCRDGVRLLQAGLSPQKLLLEIALVDARFAEYGTTHTLALAADALRYLPRYSGVQAMAAMAPVMDLCAESNRRMPPRPRPSAIRGGDWQALCDAVERERLEEAEGRWFGGFEDGRSRQEMEAWLFQLLARHFTGFGHSLIYMVKAGELFDALGDQAEGQQMAEIYGSLLVSHLLGTREDLLPYMKPYFQSLQARWEELPDLWARQKSVGEPSRDWFESVLDGKAKPAVDQLWQFLEQGVPVHAIAEVLSLAASERLLRFDVSLDQNPKVAENWLWVTHRLTFAAAVRQACRRCPGPSSLAFLFQTLAFIHSGRGMDLPRERRLAPTSQSGNWAALEAALSEQDAPRAVAVASYLLNQPELVPELEIRLQDRVLSDSAVRPIVQAHLIKTTVVAFEEFRALSSHAMAKLPVLALIRLLASPVQERRLQETVGNSIRWVAEGIMPKKLTQ
ncbi:MAG: Rieske (2Fe-2S) protein [Planctomycetota bacterium]|nr:MAG: Rieske (2Fe-2S) protein [Planctomycetota bacterium]